MCIRDRLILSTDGEPDLTPNNDKIPSVVSHRFIGFSLGSKIKVSSIESVKSIYIDDCEVIATKSTSIAIIDQNNPRLSSRPLINEIVKLVKI